MQFDVVGIGNAIVDILANVDDDFLKANDMEKGSMSLVDEKRSFVINEKLDEKTMCSGGSVANSVSGIAMAGLAAAFIGRVGNDGLGDVFITDIQNTGVSYKPMNRKIKEITATSIVCITPDGERTMNTHLGASYNLDKNDIDISLVKDTNILYIEGYLWDSETARVAILKAVEVAKLSGARIAFSLSDSFCVNRFKSDFLKFIKDSVDILFANSDEIIALLDIEDINIAIKKSQELCEIVVVTMGSSGAMATKGDIVSIIPTPTIDMVVDTTGAGDLFAAGFLTGLCKRANIENCLKLGIEFASEVISHIGARPQKDLKGVVKECLEAS